MKCSRSDYKNYHTDYIYFSIAAKQPHPSVTVCVLQYDLCEIHYSDISLADHYYQRLLLSEWSSPQDVPLDLDLLLNICGCVSGKSVFSLIPKGCVFVGECMWSSLKSPSLSSSWQLIRIWARQSGWAAVLLVIASEMNYLAASETEGGVEIVIELPPPSPSRLKLLHLQCRKPFAVHT